MLRYSVIIPCFNVSSFISDTLNNILALIKNSSDVEIICIDDGSTDNTAEVLKKIAEDNKTVRFFYKQNGGVSSARNYGLSKSTGQYVFFLDADDCYVNNPFSLINSQEDSEFIFFDYKKEIPGSKKDKIYSSDFNYCSNDSLSDSLMLNGIFNKKISINICAVALKRDVIFEHKVFFNENASHCEDLDFLIRAIMVSKSFKYINNIIFKYQFRDGSAVNSVVNFNQVNKLKLFERLRNEIAKKYTGSVLNAYDFYVATIYFLLMISILKNKIETISQLKSFIEAGNVIFNKKMSFPFNKIGFIIFIYKFIFKTTSFSFKLNLMKVMLKKA